MSVKVAINIGGRERIVEFDSTPTDADIDEAYNALSSERVPSPDRQPSVVARRPQAQPSPQKKGWVDRAIEFQHPVSNPINDILGIKPKPDPTSFIKPADQIRRDIVNQSPKRPKGKSGVPSKGGYNNLIGHTGAPPPKNLPPSPDRQPSMQPAQGSLDDYLSMTPQQLDALAKQNPEAANIIYQHQMAQRGNPYRPDFTNTPLPQGFSGFTGRDTGGLDPLAKAIAEAAKAAGQVIGEAVPSLTPKAMGRALGTAFEGVGKAVGGIALSPMYMASTLGGVLGGDDAFKALKDLGVGMLDSINVFAPGLSASDRIERAINATLMLIGAAHGVGKLKSAARGGGLTHVIAGQLGIDPQLVGLAVNKALADSRFLNEVESLSRKQQVVHEGTNVGPRSFREPVSTGVQFRNGPLTASPEVIGGQLTVKQGIRGKSTLPQVLQVGEQAAQGARVVAATNIEAPGRPTSVTGTNIKTGKPLKNMPQVSGVGELTQAPEPAQQPPTGISEGADGFTNTEASHLITHPEAVERLGKGGLGAQAGDAPPNTRGGGLGKATQALPDTASTSDVRIAVEQKLGHPVGPDMWLSPKTMPLIPDGHYVGIKDVNGHRAVMTAADARQLLNVPETNDLVREIIYRGAHGSPTMTSGFMADAFEAHSGKVLGAGDMATAPPEGVTVKVSANPTQANKAKLAAALLDNTVQRLLKQYGIQTVEIVAPHQLTLSEQGHITEGTIRLSSIATDPRQTILHEIGHKWEERLTPAERAEHLQKDRAQWEIDGRPDGYNSLLDEARRSGDTEAVTRYEKEVLAERFAAQNPYRHGSPRNRSLGKQAGEGATGTPKPVENPGSGNVGSTPTASTTVSETPAISQLGNLPETGKVATEPAPKTPKPSTAPETAQVSSFWDSLDDRISQLEKKGSGGKRSTRSGATYAPDVELTALKALRLARDTGRALHDVVEEAVTSLSDEKSAQVRALVATLPHGLEYAPQSKPAFRTEPVTLGGPANDSTITYDSPTATAAPKVSGKPQPETQFETRPSNAGMDQVRKEVGLPETDGRSNKLPNESKQPYDAKRVEGWLKDASDAVERGVQPKGFEAWQTEHFHQYMESLKGAYNKNPSPELAAKIDHATRAFKAVGSPTGQALAARSVGSSGYTAGDSIEHFVKNADAGSEMPKGYQEKATAMGKAWEKQKQKVDDVAAQQAAKDAERRIQEIAGKEKKATAADEIQKIRMDREKAIQRIKAKLQDFAKNGTIMSDPFMFQTAAKGVKTLAEIAPDVMAVVRSLIKEGKVRIAGIPAETARLTGLKESDVHNIIAGAYEKTPKELPPEAQKVKDAIAKLTEQAKQTEGAQRFAINQRIKRLESQLNDFSYKPKPRTKAPKELERELIKQKSLESQIEDMRKEAIGLANRANPASAENVLGILRKTAGAVTGTVASTDMSYFLNQGLPGLLSHPNQSVRALGSAMKAAISEGNLHQLEGWLRSQPEYDLARAAGLDIGEGAGVHDIFPAQAILEKPGTVQTPFGEVGLNPIRASERAFAANAKVLRMLTFKQMLKAYETGGTFGKLFKEGSRFGPKEADFATAKLIAEWVNTMSGVGTGEVGRMLRSANAKIPILFGPSLLVSRWKLATGTPLINALINKNWRVAKMIGADYAKIAGAIYAGTKLAQQFGYDVETDPRSSNFLKIRLRGSEVWVDPWGNLQQPMRLMAQVTQGIKDKNGAVNTDATQRVEQVYRYFGYKTNPFLKIVLGNLTGEEQFTHKKMNLWSLEGIQTNLSSILPMSIDNMNEIWQANGLSTAEKMSLSALAFLGINVNDKGKGK